LRQLFVECLPLDIPEKLLVDVSGLDVGDAVHVRDLRTGEGVRVLEDEDRVVASVVAMAVEEEAPAAVEEAPTEPEVVGRKEKAEAEGEPEAKPKAEPKAEAKPK
jgi:large subunit ribosomal protein L25